MDDFIELVEERIIEDLVDIKEQILKAYKAREEEQDNRAKQPKVKKITVKEAI